MKKNEAAKEEWYKKYRPQDLDQLVGQDHIVSALQTQIEANDLRHAMILAGGTGVGKTTTARILKRELKCSDADYIEMNCADVRGIDTIRSIAARAPLTPIGGECRIWLIDEAHQLTKDAQNAFLKMLEDTPRHVYFILASSEPRKFIAALRNRCHEFVFEQVKPKDLVKLMAGVLKAEGHKPSQALKELVELVAEKAEGSPRRALVTLQAAMDHETDDARMESVRDVDMETEVFTLARALFGGSPWPAVARLLKACDDQIKKDAEGVRRMILSYGATVMINDSKKSAAAAHVTQFFVDNVYDSGRGGVIMACYRACQRPSNQT